MNTKVKVTPETGPQAKFEEIVVPAPVAPAERIQPPAPEAKSKNTVEVLFEARGNFKTLIEKIDTDAATGLTQYAAVALDAAQKIGADGKLKLLFGSICANRKIKFKKTSDLYLKVATVIVGKKSASQASKMASIIRYAASNSSSQDITQWVNSEGGWEAAAAKAARRMRPKDRTKERISNAIDWARKAAPFDPKTPLGAYGAYAPMCVSLKRRGPNNALEDIDIFSIPALTKLVLLAYEAKIAAANAREAKAREAKALLAAQQAAVAETREPAA